MDSKYHHSHLTKAYIDLGHLTHNMRLLRKCAGTRPLWPAVKANAYGHGADIVARHLVSLGYDVLCVAHLHEAVRLKENGVKAGFLILSPNLPENSEPMVAFDLEPVVCTLDQVKGLARAAEKLAKTVQIHVKVDTGMGRVGIAPDAVLEFLDACRQYPQVSVKGIASHFPKADEPDKGFSRGQIRQFQQLMATIRSRYAVDFFHFANSAAIFDLPDALFDAVRPGISIYGLKPSLTMNNPMVNELKPVLSLKSRISYLKEVSEGTGLSYGHTYVTQRPSLIASVPAGYGDGLIRQLSNRMEVLVHGVRCPQVGRICMDQFLVDVTALRGRVALGDEVVIIGKQEDEEITADELAVKIGTINYEIVTQLSDRIPRIAIRGSQSEFEAGVHS